MADVLAEPDLTLALPLDAYAPRAARHHVAAIDRPSPDLRDAVVLLTSELVTRAVRRMDTSAAVPSVELRVWMPAHVVRVELWAPEPLLCGAIGSDGVQYDLLLLDETADRWSLDRAGPRACMWFEIDRRRAATEPAPQSARDRTAPWQPPRRRRAPAREPARRA